LTLDANRWMREGTLKAGVRRRGSWQWTYPRGDDFTVGYEVDTLDPARPSVRLWYSWVWATTRQQESADYRVRLTATRPHLGGLRWWFLCPLVVDGRPCGRRVGTLHLPPHARYFGCRHCHELTYTSCRESHRWDRMFRHLAWETGRDFAAVKRAMNGIGKMR
jgi:hypothetical protein